MESASRFQYFLAVAATSITMAVSSTVALAAGEHGGHHMKLGKEKMTFEQRHGGSQSGGHGNAAGEPGEASEASRTITIDMTDNRYSAEEIAVKEGETIRFVVRNKGDLVHEFNIGTPAMHEGHQKEMMMMVDHGVLEADKINHNKMKMDMGGGKTMEHNDPNSALLEPGKRKTIVWKFSKAGTFEFACNVPGHYDAGMVGELTVK